MKEQPLPKADAFVGLTKKSAQNLAEAKNMIFRLIRIDAEPYLPYPEDARVDRVCVELDNGQVSKASIQ